jgi:hypothetical protein
LCLALPCLAFFFPNHHTQITQLCKAKWGATVFFFFFFWLSQTTWAIVSQEWLARSTLLYTLYPVFSGIHSEKAKKKKKRKEKKRQPFAGALVSTGPGGGAMGMGVRAVGQEENEK